VALTTAIASGLFVWFRQKFDAANLAAGAFLLCIVPMILKCFSHQTPAFNSLGPSRRPCSRWDLDSLLNDPIRGC
jgi:hypothetical protein